MSEEQWKERRGLSKNRVSTTPSGRQRRRSENGSKSPRNSGDTTISHHSLNGIQSGKKKRRPSIQRKIKEYGGEFVAPTHITQLSYGNVISLQLRGFSNGKNLGMLRGDPLLRQCGLDKWMPYAKPDLPHYFRFCPKLNYRGTFSSSLLDFSQMLIHTPH